MKTLKRDYDRVAILPDVQSIIALLPNWFEDYNTVHPHPGLRFPSPRGLRSFVLNLPSRVSGQMGCTPPVQSERGAVHV